MRLEQSEDGELVLVVSRRNLTSLLAKLDGYPPNSLCTLMGGDECEGVILRAEEDEVHYASRAPGHVHPSTGRRMREEYLESALDAQIERENRRRH